MIKRFDTIILEEAFDFVQRQEPKVRAKILQNIRRSEFHTDPKFFKKLNQEIWEFRTRYAGKQYRLLAFWDKNNNTKTLVVATHGIIKKTSKVDKGEIKKAMNISSEYYKSKNA